MKKSLKTMTVALTVLLTGSLAGQAFAQSEFTDLAGVKEKEQILVLQQRGIVDGVNEGIFAPQSQLTTAEGIALIVNALRDKFGLETVKLAGPHSYFPNVADGEWYSYAFSVARYKELGLPQDIDPRQPLNKEQFIYYLQQGIEATGDYPMIKIFINVADEASLTTAYQGAIQRSLITKISALDADGLFHPQAPVTRAEAAGYIFNAVRYVESVNPIKPQPDQGQDVYVADQELTAAEAVSRIAAGLQLKADDASAKASSLFEKVKDDAWYASAFVAAHETGVDLPGDIDPSQTLTKEEYTIYLQQALEKSIQYPLINIVPTAISDEAELTPGYQGAVQRSLKFGITKLDADGKFHPHKKITQEEAAAMLDKAVAFAAEHPGPAEVK
ncbi:MAG: S-layer domain protein [Paenibacillaceae bacterium]|jgi:hypothetical protein|nr:S-layer domain protein [Paenibacillaceae bacterium]